MEQAVEITSLKDPKSTVDVCNPIMGKTVPIYRFYYDNCRKEIENIQKEQRLCKECSGQKCLLKYIPYYVRVVEAYRGHYSVAVLPCPRKLSAPVELRELPMPQKPVLPEGLDLETEIPPLFRGLSLKDFQVTPSNAKVPQLINQFLAQRVPKHGLYITGPRGTGKTMLACIAAAAWQAQGHDIVFTDTGELLDALHDCPKEETEQLMKFLKKVPLLVLDDIGAEFFTEEQVMLLSQIVNYRYKYSLPMILTSSFTMGELQKALNRNSKPGERDRMTMAIRRLISHLAQMNNIVFLYGKDRRIQDQMERLNTGLFG